MLEENLDILTNMAEALLERETLDAPDVELLMKGEALPPVVESAPDALESGRRPKAVYVTKHKERSPGRTLFMFGHINRFGTST